MITIDGREVVVERVLFKDPITVPPDCKLSIRYDGEETEASIIHPPKDERLKVLWQELSFTEDMVKATPQEVFDEAARMPKVQWPDREEPTDSYVICETGNVTYLLRCCPEQQMLVGQPMAVWISHAATIDDIEDAICHPSHRELKNEGLVSTDLLDVYSANLIKRYKAIVGEYLPEADFMVQSGSPASQETIMNISTNSSLYQIVREPHGVRIINLKRRK